MRTQFLSFATFRKKSGTCLDPLPLVEERLKEVGGLPRGRQEVTKERRARSGRKGKEDGCVSGNFFQYLEFYLGQILSLYAAKKFGTILDANVLLHRGTIFD